MYPVSTAACLTLVLLLAALAALTMTSHAQMPSSAHCAISGTHTLHYPASTSVADQVDMACLRRLFGARSLGARAWSPRHRVVVPQYQQRFHFYAPPHPVPSSRHNLPSGQSFLPSYQPFMRQTFNGGHYQACPGGVCPMPTGPQMQMHHFN